MPVFDSLFVLPRPNAPRLRALPRLSALAAALALSACAVGPDYQRPAMDVPVAFQEEGPWKIAAPARIDDSQPWWQVYGDPVLNDLVERANAANQNIRYAEAQFRQAQAAAQAARASLFPTVGLSAGANRAQTNSATTGSRLGDTYNVGLNAAWEPDLWGGLRRAEEASDAATQAGAATLAGARLSIQATLTQDYLQLRTTDILKDLYQRSTAAYMRSLQLLQRQYSAGITLRSDVAQAETQLRAAQAQLIELDATRAQLEHAIAILTGRAPSGFTIAPRVGPLAIALPVTPVGVPSTLLERRPDIAAAERLALVANANIGVARAAFFPALTLSASGGYNSASFADLFNTPARVWSLGAALAQTLFDGGLRKARSAQAEAVFDASAATYRQTVLGGFQEVEDNLALLRVLEQEAVVQEQAVQAALLSERLATAQYRAGTTTYLTVVTAQTAALTNQRTAVTLLSRRLVASAALIKAIGGGWTTAQLPGIAVSPVAPVAANP